MKNKIFGWTMIATGFVLCPCHLPVTLGLVVGVLGGGTLGAFLSQNTGLVYGIVTGYFLLAFVAGWYLVTRKSKAKKARQSPIELVITSGERPRRVQIHRG